MPDKGKSATISRAPQLPGKLWIGDFILDIETISKRMQWDARLKRFTGVSGTAWLSLDCTDLPHLIGQFSELDHFLPIQQNLEVVKKVINPQTQVSLDTARRIQPGVRLGETLRMKTAVTSDTLQKIAVGDATLLDVQERPPAKGQILVEFNNVTVIIKRGIGQIIEGEAVYPARERIPNKLQLSLDGFTLILDSLTLTPKGASADVTVNLPGGLVDLDTCTTATLNLGRIEITPDCRIHVEAGRAQFGPWLVADTGLIISGRGYTLDLGSAKDKTSISLRGRGLLLHNGQASGLEMVPEPSNTGYLRGSFNFSNAFLNNDGLDVRLTLDEEHVFQALHPLNYTFVLKSGWLQVEDSCITGGEFSPGEIKMPLNAACKGLPGDLISVGFNTLAVDSNLDLVGEADCSSGLMLSWGELTRTGSEVMSWTAEANQGFLYLPANPMASFSPAGGASFFSPPLSPTPANSLTTLATNGIAGLALRDIRNLQILSPDRPGGTSNPIKIERLQGWLRVGCQGMDGELVTHDRLDNVELGESARYGYVGNTSFKTVLFGLDKINLLAQFADSAVFDSGLEGHVIIPQPCKIDELQFTDMQLTSTAHLVGGDVHLPIGGVNLDYWQLQLVATGDPTQAGVISVRTGRIVFTAAAIDEPIHFSEPFRLTWGEMLADGNLGELFFDYNNYGQRFDHIPYAPQQILLSRYDTSVSDPYLATCGTVHFTFFGPCFVNLRDARHNDPDKPYFNRYVTAPKSGEAGCEVTDLYLAKNWDDLTGSVLAEFDFPDSKMDYHEAAQHGFLGSGKSSMSFLHSDGLDAEIEIHGNTIDIRLSSAVAHDLDLGLFAQVSGMSAIYGCARIEGPLLSRISIYGLLEQAAGTGMGILSPKVASVVEVNLTTTPNFLDFTTSGNLLLQVAGSAIDVSASVHLFHDFSRGSTEGEVIGRIDCNSIMGGMEAEGQLTWYAGPAMQYLQGRMKVYLCGWVSSGGMEGGMFIGHNVDKALAWVLQTDNERFGVSNNILPERLTGLYGYGRLSFSIDFFLFGGGIELYAGMGAFSASPVGLIGEWPEDWSSDPDLELPYVVGSCGVYVHGEILGGLVSASAWADLDLRGPVPTYFEGTFGLEGCVLWVVCASVSVTAGFNSDGFYVD